MAKLWQHATTSSATPTTDPSSHDGSSEPANDVVANPAQAGSGGETGKSPDAAPVVESESTSSQSERPDPESTPKKYLLIDSNDETVKSHYVSEAEKAGRSAGTFEYKRPNALRVDRSLHPHQEHGVKWLQTCAQTPGRKGVLLADDMGVGRQFRS